MRTISKTLAAAAVLAGGFAAAPVLWAHDRSGPDGRNGMSMSDGGMMGQDGDMPMMRMMQRMSRMMDGCEKMMSGMSGEQDRERPGDPSRQAPRAPEKKS